MPHVDTELRVRAAATVHTINQLLSTSNYTVDYTRLKYVAAKVATTATTAAKVAATALFL